MKEAYTKGNAEWSRGRNKHIRQ